MGRYQSSSPLSTFKIKFFSFKKKLKITSSAFFLLDASLLLFHCLFKAFYWVFKQSRKHSKNNVIFLVKSVILMFCLVLGIYLFSDLVSMSTRTM